MGELCRVGLLVEHPKRPEWGPGKVVRIRGSKVDVFWRDRDTVEATTLDMDRVELTRCASQADAILDNIPPLVERESKLCLPATKRVTLAEARRTFAHYFAMGFKDPEYLKNERDYKFNAHSKWVDLLGNGKARQLLDAGDLAELNDRVLKVVGSVNLLASFENMALRDALKDEVASTRFYTTLFAVLDHDGLDRQSFEPYLEAVLALPRQEGGSRVATWPVATLLPFLAHPQHHMFLKPDVTQKSATVLGFDLHYDATPNVRTYDALIRLGRLFEDQIVDLGPRDFIDIQSFIFTTCGGYP